MDEAKARSHIEEHANAVVRGDMDAVIADFSDDLRPDVPQVAQVLPQPVTSAVEPGVEVGNEESVAMIRYSGESGAVKIRTQWRERSTAVHRLPTSSP
jgi:hypothetical protein